jgi:transcriptional regulator with XRE-family HTH domain
MPTDPVPERPDCVLPERDGASAGVRITLNRHRQRELYGSPLGDRVRRLTAVLGITQARLARTLGLSPAMLSQLASARRVKIGDPAVLARLQLLDQRCATDLPRSRSAVDELLEEVGRTRLQWTARDPGPRTGSAARRAADPTVSALPRRPPLPSPPPEVATLPGPADVLRALAPPARLVAAAATLAPAFPELAAVLRQAATRPPGPEPRRHPG